MSNVKTVCLRFNLDKSFDKKAWEYLQNLDRNNFKSYSQAVIHSVIEYFENQNTDERERQFIAEVISAIEKELPKFLNGCIAGIMQTYQNLNAPATPQNTEENSDIDYDFIGG